MPWQPRGTRAAPRGVTPNPGGAAPTAQGAALRAVELPAKARQMAKSRREEDGGIKQQRRRSPALCIFGVGVPIAVFVPLWGVWGGGSWDAGMLSGTGELNPQSGLWRDPTPFWGGSEGSSMRCNEGGGVPCFCFCVRLGWGVLGCRDSWWGGGTVGALDPQPGLWRTPGGPNPFLRGL